MPVRFSAQRTSFTAEQSDLSGGGDGGTPQFIYADQRGSGNEYNGKVSLDIAGAAAQLTRAGLSWSALGSPATVTFAFRSGSTGMPSSVQGFTSFNQTQIQVTLLALQAWSDVSGLTFVRQDNGGGYSDNATILFGNYSTGQEGAAAFAYLPGSTAASSIAGDVWVNSSLSYNATPLLWNYGTLTLVHEIGHALGLSHPSDYDAAEGVSITYGANAGYAEDSNQYTVMSYFRETATGASYGSGRYTSAPLLDDIAAAQRLYGANMSTRTGDTVYGFNSTADRPWFSASIGASAPIFAVWDAGGIDTLDFSGYSNAQLIDLRQGAFSNFGTSVGNVSIAIGAVIENAIGGAGNDVINGNSADNRITPGGGANRVEGGLGTDTLVFTGARSAYTITMNGQTGFISGPEGTTEFKNVEFLAFSDMTIAAPQGTGGITVSGDATNDTVNGAELGDVLSGGDGNDTIRGFDGADQLYGGRGNDSVDGGGGNDQLYTDEGNDVINGGDGNQDWLHAEAAFSSGYTVNLQLGTITGAGMGVDSVSGIEWVTGSRFNDEIIGNADNNRLDGYGGSDILRGGDGNDELIASYGEAGGGADVIKTAQQANNSIGNAISLDAAFDTLQHAGVISPSTPHATVVATTHGGREYYAFTVAANTTASFDIDGAAFDSTIRIFDASGSELASNDDAQYTGDGGTRTDSYLTFNFVAAGTYYIQIGEWGANVGDSFTTVAPAAGQGYTLHVTAPGHAVQPTYALGSELHGDAGNDILRTSVGADTLDGGSGTDTAVFFGARSEFTISVSNGVSTVSRNGSSDTVTNVERFQFSDMVTDAAGIPEAPPISGTESADTLNGTAGDDTINGLGGNDRINGLGGDDWIRGGNGNDILFGGLGSDTLYGDDGDDRLSGGDGADALDGGQGLDTVDYSADYGGVNVNLANGVGNWNAAQGDTFVAIENIIGTAYGDVLTGDTNNNRLVGGLGADQLNGGGGIDTADYSGEYGGVNVNLATGAGAWNAADGDVLTGIEDVIGTAFGDVLTGNAGDNRLTGGLGADQLNGGAGFDIADYYNDFGAVNVNLATGVGTWNAAHGDSLTGIEGIVGTAYGDVLTGDAGDNQLWGEGGQNQLYGGAGNDVLTGGGDNDRLFGGTGADQLIAWAGDDWLAGGEGADLLNGSLGNDTADYSADFGGVNVNLATQAGLWNAAQGDTLWGIENVVGTSYGDVLTGDDGDNRLAGGLGADQLNGGAGRDMADYSADFGAVNVNLINGVGLWNAAHGDVFTGIEDVTGTAYNDVLVGDAADNRLDGGAGADQLDGGTGNDTLIGGDGVDWLTGGAGADQLDGGAGDDLLVGGVGADQLTGGSGNDTADYSSEYGGVNLNLATGAGVWNAAHGDTLTGIENLIGTAYGDVLTGDGGANRLTGGAGDDVISGGAGNDTFLFGAGFGQDRISDFKNAGAADVIAFASGMFTGFADLMAHAVQSGSDVVITLGGNTLTLTGVQRSSLQSGDFTFGGSSAPAQAGALPDDASAKLWVHDAWVMPVADDALILPASDDDHAIALDAWDHQATAVAEVGGDVSAAFPNGLEAAAIWPDDHFSLLKLHDAHTGWILHDPWA